MNYTEFRELTIGKLIRHRETKKICSRTDFWFRAESFDDIRLLLRDEHPYFFLQDKDGWSNGAHNSQFIRLLEKEELEWVTITIGCAARFTA